MSLLKQVIRLAAPTPELTNYQRFLFIGPHPDDIEIGAGATAARFAAEGREVSFVICLDGRFGLTNAPKATTPQELAEIRKAEALRSAAMLGVHDVRFLAFSDGGFYDKEALLRALAKEIGQIRPQVIFAPDPCVTSECHPDHLAMGEAARRLACLAPYGEIMEGLGASSAPVEALAYYMTAKPNRFVKTTGYLDRQLASVFSCHTSQFPAGCAEEKAIRLYLKLRAADFGLRSGSRSAEGFRVLGQTQMHCLPEAGD